MFLSRSHLCLASMFLIACASGDLMPANAQPLDDVPAAGLVGEFEDDHGNTCRRVDSQLAFVWREESPDPRLGGGAFRALWRGLLLVRSPGPYQLQAFVEGDVRVTLDGQTVLDGGTSSPAWVRGTPSEQATGFREIEIHFSKTQPTARFSLYWSGPDFQLEPLPVNVLFHERDPAALEEIAKPGMFSGDDRFERGRQLVHALRCTGCHEIPTALPPLPSPALDALAGNLDRAWIVDWLTSAEKVTEQPLDQRRMPHFSLSKNDAQAMAAWLTQQAPEPRAPQAKTESATHPPRAEKADATIGEELFVSIGCLACHRRDADGASGLFGGTDLSRVGEKRTREFFARWLKNPAEINRDHRMPVFDLSPQEISHLAQFLTSLVDGDATVPGEFEQLPLSDETANDVLARGRQLVAEHRCAACHTMPKSAGAKEAGATPVKPARALTTSSQWLGACVGAGDATASRHASGRPHYRLTSADAAAVQHYVTTVTAVRDPQPAVADGADRLLQSNCLACHPRGLTSGITATALPIADRYSAAIEHVAALVPPSLNSIGDKLHDAALQQAVAGAGDRRRPWLSVRMPRYPLPDDQLKQLVQMLVDADRIPDGSLAERNHDTSTAASRQPIADGQQPRHPVLQATDAASHQGSATVTGELDALTLSTLGSRLVTSEGLGCISCHAIAGVQPAAAPINARGPELAGLGTRIRQSWFRRWVANPLRIVPRVEMPAVAIPVPGVLEESLPQQIDAVWQVLNLDGFRPPKPNPVRIVRRQGIESAGEPAAVLTDVLRMNERVWIKPFVIGLPNRHNLLVDLDEARLDAWWIGDTGRQHVEGKSWYWEAAAENLWIDADAPEITLVPRENPSGTGLAPLRRGQFRSEVDQWQHVDQGVALEHRLQFDSLGEQLSSPQTVNVQQTFVATFDLGKRSPSGWQRTLRLSHVPRSHAVRLQAAPTTQSADVELSANRRELRLAGPGDRHVELVGPHEARFDDRGSVVLTADDGGTVELTLRYTTTLPVDQHVASTDVPGTEPAHALPEARPLHVAPGFSALQLALPDAIMPTGFDWRRDGTMIVTSLEGRVWQARDSDGDGLHDAAAPVSDDLATPFGVAAGDDYLDVINKYALLRLWDEDRDGTTERTQTLASGWGHTADYHDWATGLPRTAEGGYWVALSCQQDERSEAAAHLRGNVIRLVPRKPSRENPHRFAIERFTAGHRFPIGIAVSPEGEAFVSDNQGNYNPFNELNHLVAGARYGFINRNEKRPGFDPPLTPPAIDIPHPWTRSVNGICFLTTPSTVSGPTFGPFEGHLAGCEYDTQRLVRMSLQRVGETFQGAIYPLTYAQPVAGPPLLGPISCAVSPEGDLIIGNIRDSGWGGGQNKGNVVRMRVDPIALPAGIAEVTVVPEGFRIAFTQPVSARLAEDPTRYSIASYTRRSTPQYGGDDQQRRDEPISSIVYDVEQNAVILQLAPLRRDYVYEFQVANLTEDGAEFFPAEAHYTVRRVPTVQ